MILNSGQACSTRVNKETYPLGSMVTYYFPARDATVQANNYHVRGMTGPGAGAVAMPPVKVVWYDGGLRPPRPRDLPAGVHMVAKMRLSPTKSRKSSILIARS